VLVELYKVLLQKESELKDRSLPRTVVSIVIFLSEEDTFQPLLLVCEFDDMIGERRTQATFCQKLPPYLDTDKYGLNVVWGSIQKLA